MQRTTDLACVMPLALLSRTVRRLTFYRLISPIAKYHFSTDFFDKRQVFDYANEIRIQDHEILWFSRVAFTQRITFLAERQRRKGGLPLFLLFIVFIGCIGERQIGIVRKMRTDQPTHIPQLSQQVISLQYIIVHARIDLPRAWYYWWMII